jgi:hypothetical protein
LVIGFAVESGVGRHGFHTRTDLRCDEQGAEVAEVRPGPLARPRREAQVAHRVADDAQLGKAAIHDSALSPVFSQLFSSPGKIATGVTRFEAAGVQGR